MALIEASGAVVNKDELLSRVWQGRMVDQNRQLGTTAALRKGFIADRELIPMFADRVTSSPARSARSPGTGGQVPAEAPAAERAATPANSPPGSVSELIGEGAIGRHACRRQADRYWRM